MAEFTFDPRPGRYRDVESGRFVSAAQVREAVDATADLSAERMADAAARLRSGAITVEQWQAEMYAHVKDVHVAEALAGYGGREQMTPQRWGFVGARVRAEYGYVRNLTSEIIDGRQPLNASLDARVRQYAQAGRVTFETVQAREAAARGQNEERNILHARESCAECRGLAARGWVQRGTLPMVGARTCKNYCRCTIDRRTGRASEAA